jgi:hypothetical protein
MCFKAREMQPIGRSEGRAEFMTDYERRRQKECIKLRLLVEALKRDGKIWRDRAEKWEANYHIEHAKVEALQGAFSAMGRGNS